MKLLFLSVFVFFANPPALVYGYSRKSRTNIFIFLILILTYSYMQISFLKHKGWVFLEDFICVRFFLSFFCLFWTGQIFSGWLREAREKSQD